MTEGGDGQRHGPSASRNVHDAKAHCVFCQHSSRSWRLHVIGAILIIAFLTSIGLNVLFLAGYGDGLRVRREACGPCEPVVKDAVQDASDASARAKFAGEPFPEQASLERDGGSNASKRLGAEIGISPLALPSGYIAADSARRLASSSIGTAEAARSGSSSGDAEHASHPHYAIFFILVGLFAGTIVLQVSTFPKLHGLQHTVALFVLGLLYSLLLWAGGMEEYSGMMWESYAMWMGIDPHLLLFTLLPVLLTCDAMTIDTVIARRVSKQCMYLAGPGVALCACAIAAYLMVYFNWSWLLGLTTGAILSATDPVAVVGLLKQLGAPPALTVQIAGEALLNDGTAIVLYSMAYDIMKGTTYDVSTSLIFLARTVFGALGVGWVIGWLFVVWIQSAQNRFEHHSSTIQIGLTILCAYSSYLIAEGQLQMSGVLCNVSASLVLADHMWPSVVDRESMIQFWHMFEYLGNTIIFFLAGALTGKSMLVISWKDYLSLILLYIVLMLIRGILLFSSRPILKLLSSDRQEVSRAEAIIMTWGGLRGAVGLALAIQVSVERAGGLLDEQEANRVLFFTGGIAFLTLIINATTCPMLVEFLRLTEPDATKQSMLNAFYKQLLAKAFSENHSKICEMLMENMLREVRNKIEISEEMLSEEPVSDLAGEFKPGEATDIQVIQPNTFASESTGCVEEVGQIFSSGARPSGNGASVRNASEYNRRSLNSRFSDGGGKRRLSGGLQNFVSMNISGDHLMDGAMLCKNFDTARRRFRIIDEEVMSLLPQLPELPSDEKFDALKRVVMQAERLDTSDEDSLDLYMLRALHNAFLALVRANYWEQIEHGRFTEGSENAELLINSVSFAFPKEKPQLVDFHFLLRELTPEEARAPGTQASSANDESQCQASAKALVNSLFFSVAITIAMFANILHLFVEGAYRTHENDDQFIWVLLEIVFNTVFLVEFGCKIVAFKHRYFCELSNLFDFFLLTFGVMGIATDLYGTDASTVLGSESQVMRTNRVFRAMRIMRVFRLIRFLKKVRALLNREEVDKTVADDVRTIILLTAFARAHVSAQEKLLKYFGNGSATRNREQAQCILESQINVYDALVLASKKAEHVERQVLVGLNVLHDAANVVQDLNRFICEAHAGGVINAREADSLLKPLNEHSRIWISHIQKFEMGISKTKQLSKSSSLVASLEDELRVIYSTKSSDSQSSARKCNVKPSSPCSLQEAWSANADPNMATVVPGSVRD